MLSSSGGGERENEREVRNAVLTSRDAPSVRFFFSALCWLLPLHPSPSVSLAALLQKRMRCRGQGGGVFGVNGAALAAVKGKGCKSERVRRCLSRIPTFSTFLPLSLSLSLPLSPSLLLQCAYLSTHTHTHTHILTHFRRCKRISLSVSLSLSSLSVCCACILSLSPSVSVLFPLLGLCSAQPRALCVHCHLCVFVARAEERRLIPSLSLSL